MMTLCECGCGGEAKPGRRFIKGHNSRMPEVREKIGKAHRGKPKPSTTIYNLTKKDYGVVSVALTGKPKSEEHIENLSKAKIKYFEDPVNREKASDAAIKRFENPEEREKLRTGKLLKCAHCEKNVYVQKQYLFRKRHFCNPNCHGLWQKNKTYEEKFGEERAKTIKQKKKGVMGIVNRDPEKIEKQRERIKERYDTDLIVWNKDLTKENNESVLKISESMKSAWKKLTPEERVEWQKTAHEAWLEKQKEKIPSIIIDKIEYKFPSQFERDSFTYLLEELNLPVIGYWTTEIPKNATGFIHQHPLNGGRIDFAIVIKGELILFWEPHGLRDENETEESYTNERRKLLDKNEFRGVPLIVTKNQKEVCIVDSFLKLKVGGVNSPIKC